MSTLNTSILRNSLVTPDGTEIVSRTRHDYVTHTDTITGKTYMVDGGLDYLHRYCHGDEVDTSKWYKDDDHEHNRKYTVWGTYGKDGDQPLRFVPVMDMETSHIEAVLETCHPAPQIKMTLARELDKRAKEREE